ncbi:hypothetical protein BB560_001070 [Smittium megazygosporum]|uniref:Uncharacterized protein n=1 Tax=Smittium megazygosporum TaxID=133381 RepID=A0A2T9ZIM5_9FUNG|nr:hypothetical protein BB560_001070 [Smittium megazygosporum]
MFKSQVVLGLMRFPTEVVSLASFVGTAHGIIFTLVPKLTTELWGHENFGIGWGLLSAGIGVGTHICNAALASSWSTVPSKNAGATLQGQNHTNPNSICNYECLIPISAFTAKLTMISIICYLFILMHQLFWKR